ncbi:MAG TPA: hypothetical protein VM121_11465 [Acidimicrobiales bacterium]|nr:hypothetical protein [Acidimicrobiales bacterium]
MSRQAGRAVAATAVLLAVACSGGSTEKPEPTTTPPPPSSSTSFTVITAPGNPRTTTTIPTELSPGEATLNGTVGGPDGPVPDAIVRVERLTGDEEVSVDIRAVNGGWQLPAIRGGRYRVRAWRAPDMAQLEPEIFFLGSTETRQVNLLVTRFGEVSVTVGTEPAPLPVGQPAVLVTQVVTGAVDAQGVVRANPRPGLPVQLVPAGGLTLESQDRGLTDSEGNSAWRVRCLAPGPPSVALLVGNVRYSVIVPACAPG